MDTTVREQIDTTSRTGSDFLRSLWSLWKAPAYFLPFLFFALVGFGSTLIRSAVGFDDLSADWQIYNRFWIRAGRPGWWGLTKLLDGEAMQPFVLQFVGLTLIMLSISLFCVIFLSAAEGALSRVSLTLFSCAMLTYPLINESWTFDQNCEMIGVGFLLTAIALAVMQRWIHDEKAQFRGQRWALPVCAFAIFLFLFFTYEAFAIVYVGGVLCVLVLRFAYVEERTLLAIVKRGLLYAVPILSAYAPKLLIPFTRWYGVVSFRQQIKDILLYYGVFGKWYLPIAILQVCVIIACIFALVWAIRKKPTALLLFFGLIALLFSMEFLVRSYTGYRTNLYASLFVGFIVLLLSQLRFCGKPALRMLFYGLAFFFCFRQATNLNHWFQLDERQYLEQATAVSGIAERLQRECDCKKPLEFVGLYELSDTTMEQCAVSAENPGAAFAFKLFKSDAKWLRYWQSGYYPYLVSGLEADDTPGLRITKLMDYLGYPNFSVGTRPQYEEANRTAIDMPVWPASGSIRETEEYIIIKLGELWIPPDSSTIQYAE